MGVKEKDLKDKGGMDEKDGGGGAIGTEPRLHGSHHRASADAGRCCSRRWQKKRAGHKGPARNAAPVMP